MTFPETLVFANATYHKSCSLSELTKARDLLVNLLQTQIPSQENFLKIDGLTYRINAKILAVKYFDGGYLQEDYDNLSLSLTKFLSELEQKNYKNTTLICQNLLNFARLTFSEVSGVGELLSAVQDENGNRTTEESAKLEYLISVFSEKIDTLCSILPSEPIFPTNVEIFNFKERVLKDLRDVLKWLQNEFFLLDTKEVSDFLAKNLTSFDNENFPCLLYSENLAVDEHNTCTAFVISSPLNSEVNLFVKSVAVKLNATFKNITAFAFNDKSFDFIDKIFALLQKDNVNLVINGLKSYIDGNKEYLLSRLLQYSKSGLFVLAIDTSGTKNLYNEFVLVSTKQENLSPLDVSLKYLRMPSFNSVVSIFKEKNMIAVKDHSFIKEYMPYMGYEGLNKCVYLFGNNKKWKDEGIRISSVNSGKIGEYLLSLPSQDQFISRDWIDLNLQEKTVFSHRDFDYDAVYFANPTNVRKIIESDENLFCKCGLVARYLTLAGADYSVWKTLDLSERERRVSCAVNIITNLLNCQYEPEVKIIENSDWTAGGAGGLCQNGGKRIIFKDECTLDYEWLIRAICHECYHAFQHTVIDNGYKSYLFGSLGVSASRLSEWNDNFLHYVPVSKNEEGYLRQLVEADARIFEEDCFTQSSGKWNLFNLE